MCQAPHDIALRQSLGNGRRQLIKLILSLYTCSEMRGKAGETPRVLLGAERWRPMPISTAGFLPGPGGCTAWRSKMNVMKIRMAEKLQKVPCTRGVCKVCPYDS